MKVFYSETHRTHNPPFEVYDGGERVAYLENPDRLDKILSALQKTDWAEVAEPRDFGLEPILAVHDAEYLRFLATAWDEWLSVASDAQLASGKTALLPATFALRRRPHRPKSMLGRAGYHMMDLSAVIVAGTYKAALASANCALSAAETITREPAAFALCRPPGHHAGRDYCAGYCFINNAAVAANWLLKKGRVALLDIDYHAGNGTQDIFYERGDVLTVSLHGDPDFEYPYFAGYADETGAGAGMGLHRNFPLPSGTDDAAYLSALDSALALIRDFTPDYLVLSAGMDIYEGDLLGKFKISRAGISEIGWRIAALRLPTLTVLEGGYNNQELGGNVVTLLSPLADFRRMSEKAQG
jgi:acetoin utilization deacetylase AcuC-like enzyme